MRIDALRQALYATGAKDCHIDRVLRAWTQAKALDSGPRHQPAAEFLPLPLRNALPRLAAELAGPAVAQAIQLGIEYDPAPPFAAV